MIARLPRFVCPCDYVATPDRRWLFFFRHDVSVRLGLPIRGRVSFRDNSGREWAGLDDDLLTIRARYAWDGPTMSPKFRKAMLPSGIHDVLYQFLRTGHMRDRIDKATADLLFYHAMKTTGFLMRGPYYHAVRKFGHHYLKNDNPVHSVLLP